MTEIDVWLRRVLRESALTLFDDTVAPDPTSVAWKNEATNVLQSASLKKLVCPENIARSERNPFLIKFCLLYDSALDIEVRLNYYYNKRYALDSVHNHKWKFASLLLRGSVVHYIFPPGGANLQEAFVTTHRAGELYLMPEPFGHCFLPSADSLTLMVRGPRSAATWTKTDFEVTTLRPIGTVDDEQLKSARQVLTEVEYADFLLSTLPRLLTASEGHT